MIKLNKSSMALSLCFIFYIFLQWPALSLAALDTPPGEHYLTQIDDLDDFIKMAKITKSVFGEEKQVKVVYWRAHNPNEIKLFFVNTHRHEFHSYFVNRALGLNIGGNELNKNYAGTGQKRMFNFGTLTVSPREINGGKTEILFDIWNGDSLEGEYLEEFYQVVQNNLSKSKFNMVFRTLSDLHEKNVKDTSVPHTNNEEIFAGKKYWPLSIPNGKCEGADANSEECHRNKNSVVGYVRLIRDIDEETLKSLEPTDIAIFLKDLPNEIGFVAGIVTQAFQTPLSHINIKSKNRGTANISHQEAEQLFAALDGQFVRLFVDIDELRIKNLNHLSATAKQKAMDDYLSERQPSLKDGIAVIRTDASQAQFVDLRSYYQSLPSREEHSHLISQVGAKAANIALLQYVSQPLNYRFRIEVPGAYGLPFYFYDLFMEQEVKDDNGALIPLREYVKNKLETSGLLKPGIKPRTQVEPVLTQIRNKYLEVKLPKKLLDVFREATTGDLMNSPIHQSQKHPRIRLRSSTNSEDLEGFTGAGLYESTGINLYKKDKVKGGYKDKKRSWQTVAEDLQEKIPLVYSGVWNTRAYMEREWFQLYGDNHLRVKVALAVHQAFPYQTFAGELHEVANGVVATKNIYKQDSGSGIAEVYINSQHWDFAITNPPTDQELKDREQPVGVPYRTEESLVTAYANDDSVIGRKDEFRWWFSQGLNSSSINDGKDVLMDNAEYDGGHPHQNPTPEEYGKMEKRRLSGAFLYLKKIMKKVYRPHASKKFDIEGEWKVLGPKRKIMIKQMREFAVPTNN